MIYYRVLADGRWHISRTRRQQLAESQNRGQQQQDETPPQLATQTGSASDNQQDNQQDTAPATTALATAPDDSESNNTRQSLHEACQNGSLDLARRLLEAGADPNHPDEDGFAPLHHASRQGSAAIARLLLHAGASATRPDKEGFLPVHHACQRGFPDVVRLLLGADLDDDGEPPSARATARDLSTPLHCAAQKQKQKQKAHLAAENDDDDDDDDDDDGGMPAAEPAGGEAALLEIVELLVRCGADVRALDADGWMPIVYARRFGFWEVVCVLVHHGGDDGFGMGYCVCSDNVASSSSWRD